MSTQAQGSTAATCAAAGPRSVGDLHREWILIGWDRRPGAAPFDFGKQLGRFYDPSTTDGVFYDDMDPQHRVVRSPLAYGAIWEPIFTTLRSATHGVALGPIVRQGAEVGSSSLQFIAKLEDRHGKVTAIRTMSSLAWRCTSDGWKITSEHNSSQLISAETIDAELRGVIGR